eukprot:SAG31_NODE_903_length_11121_cov_10.117311_2_plen_225_part_00
MVRSISIDDPRRGASHMMHVSCVRPVDRSGARGTVLYVPRRVRTRCTRPRHPRGAPPRAAGGTTAGPPRVAALQPPAMDALDGSAAADPAEVRPVGDRHAQTSFGRPMHAVDYCLIVALLACTVVGNWRATRHTQSVADFVAANRAAGPYLLATADGTAGLGAISIVASFEQFYAAGLAPRFWGFAATPISMIITLSGYVRWRYRATRCLTMSEFFEYRYGSKR